MMYPFMTLNDDTEIVHSEMKPDGRVKVYIERPDEKYGFRHATCWLPDYTWEDMMRIIEARSNDVLQQWYSYFGEIRYFC